MASGLGLVVIPCAAEDSFPITARQMGRVAAEALFVTWYHVGRVTSHALGHRGMIERIT